MEECLQTNIFVNYMAVFSEISSFYLAVPTSSGVEVQEYTCEMCIL